MAKKESQAGGVLAVLFFIAVFVFIIVSGEEEGVSYTEDEYVLQLDEELNLGLVNRDDMGISVALVVDISGSMYSSPSSGGDQKYIQASQAITEVVNVLDRIVNNAPAGQVLKVGIILFDDEVRTLVPLKVMDKAGLANLRRIVSNPASFDPDGSTAIGLAIESGASMLLQSGTILRSMIVVTDGENTEGVEPSYAMAALYNNRNTLTTPDFPVRTNSILVSFIGFDIDGGYFQPFSQYGARVTSAANKSELTQSLVSLLEADITKLEAPAF